MHIITDAYPLNEHYCEISQQNPIRWALGIYTEEDNTFIQLLKEFKCRDYFNDLAYFYTVVDSKHQGTSVRHYGFPVGELPYDVMREQKGIYVLLRNCYESFLDNTKSFLANFFVEHPTDGNLPQFIPTPDPKQVLCFIPEFFLQHTFRISLVTLLIRMCNGAYKQDTDLYDQYKKIFDKQVWYADFTSCCYIHSTAPCYQLEVMGTGSALYAIHDNGFLVLLNKYKVDDSHDDDYDIEEDAGVDCESL